MVGINLGRLIADSTVLARSPLPIALSGKYLMRCSSSVAGTKTLKLQHGEHLAYERVVAEEKQSGQCRGILYLNGLLSTRDGLKSRTLLESGMCNGHEAAIFDYRGHGSSSGVFTQLGPQDWLQDALAVLDHVMMAKHVVLVGSSIGGWLAVHVALLRPQRVHGLVLVAPAFDCSANHWAALSSEDKQAVIQHGHTPLRSPYFSGPNLPHLGLQFFVQGAALNLVGGDAHRDLLHLCDQLQRSNTDASSSHEPKNTAGPVQHTLCLPKLACPVEIMHGDADDVVPVGNSQLFIAQLIEARPAGGEPQCLLHNLPGGDHRVSSPQALQLMLQLIVRMMKDESTMCSDASIPGSHIA